MKCRKIGDKRWENPKEKEKEMKETLDKLSFGNRKELFEQAKKC